MKGMSGIRLLVGTRKGAFVLTSDGKREKWNVSGPHFAGWEIYHVKGSPVDPNRLYASQTSAWFGQIIQRSDDGGKTWETPGSSPEELKGPEGMPKGESNKFVYDGIPGTHMWYDGTQHPWEFKRVWHLEPSLDNPDHVYAGVEDAALFESKDGGKSWNELSGLRQHDTGPKWQPGAGGMCLHSIILDPKNPKRIFIAISAAGAFRTDDGGKRGSRSTKVCIRNTFPIRTQKSVTACITSRCIHRARARSSCRNIGTSCGATTRAIRGARSAGICRATSGSRSTFTRTSRRRFTSCRSRATPSIIRPTANCASIAAGAAATNGKN